MQEGQIQLERDQLSRKPTQPAEPDRLKFIVAPHIVQDLGLNLYTTLPKVVAEFVANSYDADSPWVKITLDRKAIQKQRQALKTQYDSEKKKAMKGQVVKALAERTLGGDLAITIEDNGHGMSRADLQAKFLVAGRRRRENESKNGRTLGGRVLMGRKGLGKLAGFGVAKTVEVTSRARGEKFATRITLDFDNLIKVKDTNEIPIDEEKLDDGGGIEESGTRVVLKRLLYEPMKAKLETISHEIGDHFAMIDAKDFSAELNGKRVVATPRQFAYAWPEPSRPMGELAHHTYQTEDGRTFGFDYRLRFTIDDAALAARERGIRVYAHHRLASAASLLDADTNMHGFRMTDYLDGIVYADFIDDQPEDYIATDRQGLRWESPLLLPMYEFLSAEIKKGCYERQRVRDGEKENEVSDDRFTTQEIKKAGLSKREEKVAFKIAGALSGLHKKGLKDTAYKTQFKQVLSGLGRGEILTSLSNLAKQQQPELDRVVAEVTKLTAEQLDGFFTYVRGRINGIEALRKIVGGRDFAAKKNEKALHTLLNECPWLIDPTFFEFLTSDRREGEVFDQLAKELKVGDHVPKRYSPNSTKETTPGDENLRPDLVFLLGNIPLNRIVVVELKAPNTPLHGEHYRQLQGYVRNTEKWLKRQQMQAVQVEGLLIGSMAVIKSNTKEVEWLDAELEKTCNQGQFRVKSIDQMLKDAELVHRGLLDAHQKAVDSDKRSAPSGTSK